MTSATSPTAHALTSRSAPSVGKDEFFVIDITFPPSFQLHRAVGRTDIPG
jgi:hypothetical protein